MALKTAKDEKHLELSEIGCPICLEILYEPITMPCKHRTCRGCFDKILELSNLHCPFCKIRISTWCRKAKKTQFLIDKKLWERIQNEFPEMVADRRNGVSELDTGRLFEIEWSHEIVENGIIAKEYQAQMEAIKREREEENRLEEEKSRELIDQLLKEEKEQNQLNRAVLSASKSAANVLKENDQNHNVVREPSKHSKTSSSGKASSITKNSTPGKKTAAFADLRNFWKPTASSTATSSSAACSTPKPSTSGLSLSAASSFSAADSSELESAGVCLTPELLAEQKRLEASIAQQKEDEALARRLQMVDSLVESPQTRSMKRPRSEGPRQATLEEMFNPVKRSKRELPF